MYISLFTSSLAFFFLSHLDFSIVVTEETNPTNTLHREKQNTKIIFIQGGIYTIDVFKSSTILN